MKRRDFLRKSTAAAATTLAMPYFVPSHVLAAPGRLGANDRIKLGFIGVGGRARQHMSHERIDDQADIVAVADCYLRRLDDMAKDVPGTEKWKRYQDYHQLLEKEKLDAVFIPTTTHARVLISIDAMQAGLDVYAEKPVALTVAEGRSLVKAVKKYDRVFQAGTQQRSMPINVFASKLVREGALGKILAVMACNFIGPEKWTPLPAQAMPAGLDWNQWCNQTELRPYHKQLHFGWAKWWDYDSGGKSWGVSGWGTHALDQVQCALGTDDTGPVEIWPEGPGYGRNIEVTMRYANGTLLRLHGPLRDKKHYPELPDLGAIFIGEGGQIEIKRGQCETNRPDLFKDAPPNTPAPGPGETVDHIKNFFDCMRSRRKPNADAETAHRATTVCILVNICRELGRKLRWDPKAERFENDEAANKLLSRPRREGFELPKEFV